MEHISEYRLIEYNSGELEGDEMSEVENHLESCDKCRERLIALREDLGAVAAVFPAEPEAAFWASYLPRLRSKMEKGSSVVFGYIHQLSTALVGAAAAAVLLIFLNGGFNTKTVPLYFEEWSAVNLYEPLPTDIDSETFNEAFSQIAGLSQPEFMPVNDYDITEMLNQLSSDEVNQIFDFMENQSIL
ncbi:MAG: zf-HC2 domain-containing protein [candidate division Zixibacteria bacterium]|nr:zf-HC2 domain-containing protein [Candidatus Tariuqbacter arcticus]